jgi:hypothetical protein
VAGAGALRRAFDELERGAGRVAPLLTSDGAMAELTTSGSAELVRPLGLDEQIAVALAATDSAKAIGEPMRPKRAPEVAGPALVRGRGATPPQPSTRGGERVSRGATTPTIVSAPRSSAEDRSATQRGAASEKTAAAPASVLAVAARGLLGLTERSSIADAGRRHIVAPHRVKSAVPASTVTHGPIAPPRAPQSAAPLAHDSIGHAFAAAETAASAANAATAARRIASETPPARGSTAATPPMPPPITRGSRARGLAGLVASWQREITDEVHAAAGDSPQVAPPQLQPNHQRTPSQHHGVDERRDPIPGEGFDDLARAMERVLVSELRRHGVTPEDA